VNLERFVEELYRGNQHSLRVGLCSSRVK
jgi:hypothetical protein